jgi:hypothetical protein
VETAEKLAPNAAKVKGSLGKFTDATKKSRISAGLTQDGAAILPPRPGKNGAFP